TTRSPSSHTTCSRRRASPTSQPSCISASWSSSTRPARSSRRQATGARRTTSPAASADLLRTEREKAMADHTVRAYDDELTDLAGKIAEMGGLAEQQVADSVTALSTHDGAMAQRIITADQRIDK